MLTEEPESNHVHKAITCPHCGSHNISFVTEYHKCIGARIAVVILSLVAILFQFINVSENPAAFKTVMTALIGLAIVVILIAIFINESKTHVQSICRDCGHLWLLN